MGRRVCPQPSPTTWPLSSNSSAGSFQNLCFPRSSTRLCSKPRRYPTLKTRLLPSSCCPVCCLPETLPVCIISSPSSPEFLRGSMLTASTEHFIVAYLCSSEMMKVAPQVHWEPDDHLESRDSLCTLPFTSSQQGRDVWKSAWAESPSPACLHRKSTPVW